MFNNNDYVYMRMAEDIAKLSKCVKYQVGTIIVNNGKIISTGVNGTKKGQINCCDVFKNRDINDLEIRKKHSIFSEMNEIHSEMNAILNANIKDLNGADLYCNYIPCYNCLKHISHVGINRIFYKHAHHKYHNNEQYNNLIKVLDIKLYQIIEG